MSIKKREGRRPRQPSESGTMPRMSQRAIEPRPTLATSTALAISDLIDLQPATSDQAAESSSSDAPSDTEPRASLTPGVQSPVSAANDPYIPANMNTAGRPYRSHKYPACVRCHKRRSRCTVEVPGQACLLCRMHGVPCSSATNKKDERSVPKVGFVRRSLLSEKEDSLDELSHIVGPIIARDTHVLENYLPPGTDRNGSLSNTSTSNAQNSQRPIYHAAIPRRRPSPNECYCARNLPGELLDRVEPFLDKLVALYFEHLHMCFPIVEESCLVNRIGDRSSLPQPFLCNFHAYTLFYWDLSPALAPYARPDQDFAWQVAMSANNVEMQKSDLSIIIGTSINIAGRPSMCLVSNTINVARIVALSHSVGLNHDCSEWKISAEEKRVRHKTWWSVVVHDRWFNFANGTPPHITKGHYDAPIPTVEVIAEGRLTSIKHVRAAECYIALCNLTEIIGDILPLIYHLRSGDDSRASEQTSRSEIELNRWVDTLPSWLQLHEFDARPSIPGLVNLQLSYLSVRMLLRRIAWHEIGLRETDPHSSWLLGCQAAADEIVRFVTTLHCQDLRGFWLPYNAHHFTSAVTLLLRCALQTSYAEVRRGCMQSARALIAFLRKQKEENGWDLAETSLPPSEAVLKRIEEALPMTPPLRTKAAAAAAAAAASAEMTNGSHHHANGLDVTSYLGEPAARNAGPNWQMSIEELFPDVFSDFTDTALFEGAFLEAS